MDVRQMRYIVACADELNFTRAAAVCNVSQPPLSRAISQLEDEVGQRLFERNSHRVVLTPAGESLVHDARRALGVIEDGIRHARLIGQGLRGTLSIGFGGTPAYRLWPRLIRDFRAAAPDVQIRFSSMPVLDQIEALRDRRIDLGVVRLPVHDELLQTLPVHREPLTVAMPAGLGERSGWHSEPVQVHELSGVRHVAYAPRRGFNYRSDLRALCRLAGFEPNIVQEGQTTEAVVGMVACGEGVAVIPFDGRRLAMHRVVFRPLDIAELPESLGYVEFALAWNADHETPAVREFVKVAASRLHGLDAPKPE